MFAKFSTGLFIPLLPRMDFLAWATMTGRISGRVDDYVTSPLSMRMSALGLTHISYAAAFYSVNLLLLPYFIFFMPEGEFIKTYFALVKDLVFGRSLQETNDSYAEKFDKNEDAERLDAYNRAIEGYKRANGVDIVPDAIKEKLRKAYLEDASAEEMKRLVP